MSGTLESWWRGLDHPARARWTVVGWLMALHLLGHVLLVPWLIEDAAITFSFANHAALGEGFVAYPGGERVEGFSNPSWTLILLGLRLVGISPFIAAKLLGAVLGVVTLALVHRIGVLWFGRTGLWAIAPAALLAVDPQHIIWNASGLENSIVVACLAAGMLVALDDETRPWHALSLGLLAMSRPEAPVYAAVLGGTGIIRVVVAHGVRAGLVWGVTRGVIALTPWLAWEAFSYAYFAWPFPNTYYAKLADGESPELWTWSHRGWGYLRGWSTERGAALLIPLLIIGQTGLEGARKWVGIALSLLTWAILIPGTSLVATYWNEPVLLGQARIALLLALGAGLPFIGFGRRGATGRSIAWWMMATVIAFVLLSSGDWMVGHRWLSFAALPLALLLADATHAVALATPTRLRTNAAIGLLSMPIAWGIVDYVGFLNNAETTPWDISRRIAYIQGAQDRLQLDHMTYLEVDFGGTMWWSGDDLVDLAGLNDVPIAHHAWEPEFFGEYLYKERSPEMMHAHGSWATRTRIQQHDEWRDYIEIPGYPSSRRRFHVGNLIRRDLIEQAPNLEGFEANFDKSLSVTWRTGAPYSAPGEVLNIELGWRTKRRPQSGFRALFVLQDDARQLVWELPPAYDWIPTAGWLPSKQYVSRHTLDLPADLTVGDYDVALVVIDEVSDAVRPADPTPARPGYAAGEARWQGAVRIVSRGDAQRHATKTMRRVRSAAEAGACEDAERLLLEARRTLHPDRWTPHERPEVARTLAVCWAWRAETSEVQMEKVEAIRRARRWDHHHPEVLRVGTTLADAWVQQGDLALSRDDLERAHASWVNAIRADPTRSWLRRKIETWRDVRIGLTPTRPERTDTWAW